MSYKRWTPNSRRDRRRRARGNRGTTEGAGWTLFLILGFFFLVLAIFIAVLAIFAGGAP
jgi:hypothetical protein